MKKNFIRTTFLIFFIILVINQHNSCVILAQDIPEKAGLITLYLGEVKAIPINNPNRVVISKPEVADVTSVSTNEMLIVGKGQGTTDLVWWDNFGRHQLQLEVYLEDMSPIKGRIDNILKEMNFPDVFSRSMDSEGKVLLLGKVKTSQDLERISIALASLKGKIVNLIQVKEEETMVEIGVQVLELNKDATTTLGFSWPGSLSLIESSAPTTTAQTGLKDIFHVSDFTRNAFNITLEALVQEGKARILSQPHLACQSGKEAELLVGGEKPIMTTTVAATTGAQATNVEYKEFGIKLKIKPTVSEDKQIKLALNVEVSEVGTAETIGSASSPTAKAYPLTKRNASTELFLKDNQTMVIGGLSKQKSEEDIRKTPFLGDIPILGLLFRRKTSKTGGGQGERGDTELFLTLTPNIIKEEVTKEAKEEPKPEAKEPLKEEAIKEEVKPQAPSVIGEGLAKEEVKPKAKTAEEKRKKKKEAKAKAKERAKAKAKAKAKVSLEEEPKVPTVLKEGAPVKEELKVEPKEAKAPTKEKRKKKKEPKVKVSLEEPTIIEETKPFVQPIIEEKPKALTPAKEALVKEKIKLEVSPPVDEAKNQALLAYLAKIAQLIRDNLTYPWIAKQMNMQGALRLGMHLFYTGQLLGVEVKEPSGCTLLDDDAIKTVKKLAPYPSFPAEINQKELRIDLPIVYKIE